MSRYLRFGGVAMVLGIAAVVIGVTTPAKSANAMVVNASLAETGSIPANDYDTQTVTLDIELDAPETSVTQARIRIDCDGLQCGMFGWSERFGFVEPNAAQGFGNEYVRLDRHRSSYAVRYDQNGIPTATISFVYAMRESYGTHGINSILYTVNDSVGGSVPWTWMVDTYAVQTADSLRTTLQSLTFSEPVIEKNGEMIQTATLTFAPGETSAGVGTVRIGINRGTSQEMGSFSCNRFFVCQEVGAYGNDLVRLNTEGGSRFEIREDGTTVVTFMWTVLPDAPTVAGNTITYYLSEIDGYETDPETVTAPTFDVIDPLVPPSPPVEPTDPPLVFPVAPEPGYSTPLYGTPGNGIIHLSWTAVDPYIVPNYSNIGVITYSVYWWLDGQPEENASSLIAVWPVENPDPGDPLSFDLYFPPGPGFPPGYTPVVNGSTYHVKVSALVPISSGGPYSTTEVFTNTVTVTPTP